MKKKISILLSAFLLLSGLTSCDTNEVHDQLANIAYSEDEHVLGVKNGTNSSYPDITWGEAFENYSKRHK